VGVEGGRAYTYSVRARDRAGNLGGAAELVLTLPGAPVGAPPAGDSFPNPPTLASTSRPGDWARERHLVSVRHGRLPRQWLRGAMRPERR
jgi:hypothetical protein